MFATVPLKSAWLFISIDRPGGHPADVTRGDRALEGERQDAEKAGGEADRGKHQNRLQPCRSGWQVNRARMSSTGKGPQAAVSAQAWLENGWLFTTKTGLYGTDYRQRALVTAIGLGANRAEDTVYPVSDGPDLFQKFDGAKKYVMHFKKGLQPPVNGFWSLTMYDANYFFVPNRLNRYTLSPRDDLKANPDGSVDLYIQHESPGAENEANWLPAPADRFILMLRMYWPKEKSPSLLNGTWSIPRVSEAP